jgi:hypothetical protein
VTLDAAGGNITLNGAGYGTPVANTAIMGVHLLGAVLKTTGSGTIAVNGVGGASPGGTVYSTGVMLDAGSIFSSASGAISISGSAGSNGDGVDVLLGSTIKSLSGNITIDGLGAAVLGSSVYGIWLNDAGTLITTGGNIAISGSASSTDTTTHSDAIYASTGAAVQTTGSGTITMLASGGTFTDGLRIEDAFSITSAGGLISLSGSAAGGVGFMGVSLAQLATTGPTVQSAGGNINIFAGAGVISETAGSIITTGLLTTSSVGGTTLTGTNAVGSYIALNTGGGDINLNNATTNLNVGGYTASMAGITNTGGGNVIIVNTGDITLPTIGVINDAGGVVTLASTGGGFINNSGSATPISAASADIYTTGMASTYKNGMVPITSLFSCTYAGGCGAQVIPATGYSFLYAQTTAPTLTVSAIPLFKLMGVPDPALSYTVTGLLGSDTAATVLSGSLTRATGETPGSYAINLGTLSAFKAYGYNLSFSPSYLSIDSQAMLNVFAKLDANLLSPAASAIPFAAPDLTSADGATAKEKAEEVGKVAGGNKLPDKFAKAPESKTLPVCH